MVWSRLRSAFDRWRRPRRRVAIELTPEEQIIVQYLLRFGEGGEEDLFQEVSTRRWIPSPHSVLTSLVNLQIKGFIARAGQDPQRGVLYRPTDRSRKVRDLLPDQPTSSLAVYLTVEQGPGPAAPQSQTGPRWLL